jgi:hypothetical protein
MLADGVIVWVGVFKTFIENIGLKLGFKNVGRNFF